MAFDIQPYLVSFLKGNSFYAEICRHLLKVSTTEIPTAAVTTDRKAMLIKLLYNPEWMGKLCPLHVKNIILHELYHIFLGHITHRWNEKDNQYIANIATDLAINSMIVEQAMQDSAIAAKVKAGELTVMPKGVYIPGEKFTPARMADEEYNKLPKVVQQKYDAGFNAALKLSEKIANAPKLKASEWYYKYLTENMTPEEMDSLQKSGIQITLDSHDWDELTEEEKEILKEKIKIIVKKAADKADQTNEWGDIPSELREDIRASLQTTIDWKKVLSNFVASIVRGHRTTSIKKINRKYPYVHPGQKRSYIPNVLIAIDQSGSVSDEFLATFFGELSNLNRKMNIDILPFDTECSKIQKWRRGGIPETKRVRCGGTDFNAPTRFVNDPKNRGKWDGVLVMTDGECCKPENSRIKRGWVLAEGQKLYFETDELQIKLTKGAPAIIR